jgi:site-specific recombinase XerD
MLALAPKELRWEVAVDAFLWAKRVKGLSAKTLQHYEIVLTQFWQSHECQSPLTCTSAHVTAYVAWLQRRGVRSTTIAPRLLVLKSFFNWLRAEGLRQDNPAASVQVKPAQPLPKTVTETHFLQAISVLNPNRFEDLRWLALFVVAYDTGARLSELLNLRVGDLDLINRMAKILGKGGKERVVFFGQKTAQILRRYLTARMVRENRTLSPDDLVFVTLNNNPIPKPTVCKVWHRAQKKAGLMPLPFHGLRHGFARRWLLNKGDAFSLQLILGHSSPETTRRYVTLWGSDLKEIHARVSPIDSLPLRLPK